MCINVFQHIFYMQVRHMWNGFMEGRYNHALLLTRLGTSFLKRPYDSNIRRYACITFCFCPLYFRAQKEICLLKPSHAITVPLIKRTNL